MRSIFVSSRDEQDPEVTKKRKLVEIFDNEPNNIVHQQIVQVRVHFLRGMMYIPFKMGELPTVTVKTNNSAIEILKEFNFTYDEHPTQQGFLNNISRETGQELFQIEEKFATKYRYIQNTFRLICYKEKGEVKWHLANHFENNSDMMGYDIWVNTCMINNSICCNVHTLNDKTHSQLCKYHNNIKYFRKEDLVLADFPLELSNLIFQYCNYFAVDYSTCYKFSLFSLANT